MTTLQAINFPDAEYSQWRLTCTHTILTAYQLAHHTQSATLNMVIIMINVLSLSDCLCKQSGEAFKGSGEMHQEKNGFNGHEQNSTLVSSVL